ncbi:MAG: hypothetical protein AAFQ36_09470 [Pseudomonadota bacterium]
MTMLRNALADMVRLDPVGAYANGVAQGGNVQQVQSQNALLQVLRERGAEAAGGNTNALGELIATGPAGFAMAEQVNDRIARNIAAANPPAPAPTSAMREYELARQQGFEGSFVDYRRQMAQAGRAQGTTVNVSNGEPVDVQPQIGTIPQGFQAIFDPERNEYVLSRISGGPEDNSDENAEARASAEDSLRLLATVFSDPNLSSVTGIVEGRLPPRSQAQQDLMVRMDQLQGQAFLTAFETLKGGGQITEREGTAAQAAIARLNRAQSVEAYQEALNDLAVIVERAVQRAGGDLTFDSLLPQDEAPQVDLSSMQPDALLGLDVMTLPESQLDEYEALLNQMTGPQ